MTCPQEPSVPGLYINPVQRNLLNLYAAKLDGEWMTYQAHSEFLGDDYDQGYVNAMKYAAKLLRKDL